MFTDKNLHQKTLDAFSFFLAILQKEPNDIEISAEEYDTKKIFVLKERTYTSTTTHIMNDEGPRSRTCLICPNLPDFIEPIEKRNHFLSQWHKTNVKRAHYNLSTLSNSHFQQLKNGLFTFENESISQTELDQDLSDTDSEYIKSSPIGPWISFLNLFAGGESNNAHPLCYFPEKFSIHSSVFELDKSESIFPETIFKTAERLSRHTEYYYGFIYITADLYSISVANYGCSSIKWIFNETKKTYSCRKKQGGSQLLRDKKGKIATSSGSILRRENELSLVRSAVEKIKSINHVVGHSGFRLFISISSHLKEYVNLENIFEKSQLNNCKYPSGLMSDKTDPESLFKEMISLGKF